MAQSYFPVRPRAASPPAREEIAEKQLKAEDVQEAYLDHKNR